MDQVPTKIAPDVIKNTNLKIVHRTLDRQDRDAMAGAMAMSKPQNEALSTLTKGCAAVFSEGDDVPLLVRIPFDPKLDEKEPPRRRRDKRTGEEVSNGS